VRAALSPQVADEKVDAQIARVVSDSRRTDSHDSLQRTSISTCGAQFRIKKLTGSAQKISIAKFLARGISRGGSNTPNTGSNRGRGSALMSRRDWRTH
jgi:hypothetical protein